MHSNSVTKAIAVLLVAGILSPAGIWFAGKKYFAPSHGLTISAGNGVSRWESPEDGLENLARRTDLRLAHLSGYVWIREPQGMYFILKGIGKRRFFVDGKELREMRRLPYAIQSNPVSQGLHHIELICDPSNFADDQYFVWSRDFIVPESIPAGRLYQHPMSGASLFMDLIGQWAGIFWRFNSVLLLILIAVLGGRWILQRFLLWPETAAKQRVPWFFHILLALMLTARLAGIGYQLPEGLHPDERMVENSVMVFRSANLEPRQYFWSAGFEYATAAAETAGEWILDHDLTPHFAARFLSAIFSWLSSLVLFSIGKKVFNFSIAFWSTLFLGLTLMPIEIAHQGILESTMVFFFLFAFRLLLELDAGKGKAAFAIAGLVAGLAIGIKQSAGIIVLPALIVFLAVPGGKRMQVLYKLLFWGVGAAAGFFLLSPYTLIDFSHYIAVQRWQVRSQEGLAGSELFFVGDQSRYAGVIRVIQYLVDGMGPLLAAFAAIGCVVVAWKYRKAALWILPVPLAHFALIASSASSPYHYALLLCPFVALLAAVALNFAASHLPSRAFVLPALGILLLLDPLWNVIRLESTLQGSDTRQTAEAWCNRNLPPGSRVDYEMFGPRFLMPFWNTFRIPLLSRQRWNRFIVDHHPDYYIYDNISQSTFDETPESFPVETEWFRLLRERGRVIQDFPGETYRLYNPHLIVYQFDLRQPYPPQHKNEASPANGIN